MTHRLGRAARGRHGRGAAARTRPTRGCGSGPPGEAATAGSSTGCNVENASYGLTLCAECGLVCAPCTRPAAARWSAVSVVAGDGAPLLPCGRCRQLLLEAGGPGLLVDAGAGPRELGAPAARRVHRHRPAPAPAGDG